MIRPSTRLLINVCSVGALAWIGYVFYGSFTGSGLWQWLVSWQVEGSVEGKYSPLGTFAMACFVGLVPITAIGWGTWRLLLRRS